MGINRNNNGDDLFDSFDLQESAGGKAPVELSDDLDIEEIDLFDELPSQGKPQSTAQRAQADGSGRAGKAAASQRAQQPQTELVRDVKTAPASGGSGKADAPSGYASAANAKNSIGTGVNSNSNAGSGRTPGNNAQDARRSSQRTSSGQQAEQTTVRRSSASANQSAGRSGSVSSGQPSGRNGAGSSSQSTGRNSSASSGKQSGRNESTSSNQSSVRNASAGSAGSAASAASGKRNAAGSQTKRPRELNASVDLNDRRKAGREKELAQKKKKSSTIKKIVLISLVEIITLCAIFAYGWFLRKWNLIARPDVDEKVVENNNITLEKKLEMEQGYWTFAVFGVDGRNSQTVGRGLNSDVILIVSANMDTGDIKMVSVFRDTYLNISDKNSYNKINQAYAIGGPEQALAALNKNLDLNIKDYVTFNWKAVADGINILGGVDDITISKAEHYYINAYITETVKSTGIGSYQLPSPGTYHLDGVQAVAYGRLRYMDSDFARTERQRIIIKACFEKAKKSSFSVLNNIMVVCFPEVATNINMNDVVRLAQGITKYNIVDTTGFPMARGDATIGKKGACVIPATLESNVSLLHEFLFGDENYQPSDAVLSYSQKIKEDSKLYKEGTPIESVSTSGGIVPSAKPASASGSSSKSSETEAYTFGVDEDGYLIYPTDADGDLVIPTDENGEVIYPTDEDGNEIRSSLVMPTEERPTDVAEGEAAPGEALSGDVAPGDIGNSTAGPGSSGNSSQSSYGPGSSTTNPTASASGKNTSDAPVVSPADSTLPNDTGTSTTGPGSTSTSDTSTYGPGSTSTSDTSTYGPGSTSTSSGSTSTDGPGSSSSGTSSSSSYGPGSTTDVPSNTTTTIGPGGSSSSSSSVSSDGPGSTSTSSSSGSSSVSTDGPGSSSSSTSVSSSNGPGSSSELDQSVIAGPGA